MANRLMSVSSNLFEAHKPIFEKEAQEIMDNVRSMDIADLSSQLKISFALARKAESYAADFSNISKGDATIKEFTGEVFKALDASSLSEEDLMYAEKHLLIVSSVYGLLRTSDIVRPYRLDYNCNCSPNGGKISDFWKHRITRSIIDIIATSDCSEVVNLLPGEAMKCIDMKELASKARIVKPDFKYFSDDGTLKSPHSGRLKELRGLLLRRIIQDKISSIDEFFQMEDNHFSFYPDASTPETPLFIADPK